MVTLASRWKRFGYRRINIMLMRKSGIYINHKKAYRLYKEANLSTNGARKSAMKSVACQAVNTLACLMTDGLWTLLPMLQGSVAIFVYLL